VIWAPQVIEDATGHGLLLGENSCCFTNSKKGKPWPAYTDGDDALLTDADSSRLYPEPTTAEFGRG